MAIFKTFQLYFHLKSLYENEDLLSLSKKYGFVKVGSLDNFENIIQEEKMINHHVMIYFCP